jgi:hypothetical protein
MNRLMLPLISATALLFCNSLSCAQTWSNRDAFSVRDSIEMSVFTDPYTRTAGATAKRAPDGRGFLVVTTRGLLKSNTLVSSLWYFSSYEIDAFLEHKKKTAPLPRLLYQREGILEAEQFNSYGSLITDVHWSADSQATTFLVEYAHGIHHLFRLCLATGKATDLTPNEKGDVLSPVERAGTIAFLTTQIEKPHRDDLNAVSEVITGHSLFEALFPEEYPDAPGLGKPWKLKVRFQGRTRDFPSRLNAYFPTTAVQTFTPSISPDGRALLTVVPVHEVPSAWLAYRPANALMNFVPSNASSDNTGRHIAWPWQYALVNLHSGTTTPLFPAPTAYTTGDGGKIEAAWSPSGDRVVVTTTYLPLPEGPSEPASVMPCAIAEYTLKSGQLECLAETPAPERRETLVSVEYSSTGGINAKWSVRGQMDGRLYDQEMRSWTSVAPKGAPSKSTELFIHQDMNVPPTLWARNGSIARMVWKLNPQLLDKQFGKASLYEWTDSSGYQWRGGLVLPIGPKPANGYPFVIQTHGFYNPHEFLVDGAFTSGNAAQALASAGIAVLQMEDRAGRHARPPLQEADDEIRGYESAIDQLAGKQIIDSARVGIEGFSRTAWYVEKALETSPTRYKAALLIDGVDQSYVTDVLFTPGYPSKAASVNGSIGAPPFGTGLKKWLQNAAGFNLDKVATPVRLEAHGRTFSLLGEWEIYSILEQQGKPVDFIDIPHGQHILQKPKERYVSQQGAVDWFRFWLQGYKRPDAEDKSQHQRWTAMKETSKLH